MSAASATQPEQSITVPEVDPVEEAQSAEETDSTLGEESSTYTETLRSSLLESAKENGRGYHKYRDGQYILPEDEREQERLDMQHEMCLRTFDNRLLLADTSIPVYNALDLGTGTGIWAIDYADQHPEANVVGVDISPIQPTYLPPNCKFEVDDFDNEWTYTQKFDLIHARWLLTCSKDFRKLFKQCYDNLNPGGLLEMQECIVPFQCSDGSADGTRYDEWLNLLVKACLAMGRDAAWGWKYKEWMTEAGFEDVQEIVYKWPIGPWPKDKFLKQIGAWNLVNMLDGLEGFTIRPFTKVLGMSIEECELLMSDVRKELKSKKIHAFWSIIVVHGKKPAK